MAFDREAAKASGYSDEEINAYLQANPEVAKETPPPPQGMGDEPPPPSTQIADINHGASTVATLGMGAGDIVREVAPYATGAYAIKKGADIINKRLGAVAPTVSPSGAQMSGVGSPNQPIGGSVAPTASAPKVNPATGLNNQQLMSTIQNSETMAGKAAPAAAK